MRTHRTLFLWALAAVGGLTLIAWAFPRLYPFFPERWEISRAEAEAIALERLRDIGPPVDDPYVVVRLDLDAFLERRLEIAADAGDLATVRASQVAQRLATWEVVVYPPGASRGEWTYQARIGLDGRVLALRRRVDPDSGEGSIDPADARTAADRYLSSQGIDLARFEEPQARSQDLAARTDLTLRYRSRERVLGATAYGVQVVFAGRDLAGHEPWLDEPEPTAIRQSLQALQLYSQSRLMVLFLILPFVAVFFVRKYHEGEIGVRRGAQVLLVMLSAGVLAILLAARAATQDFSFGTLTRQQTTWAWTGQMIFIFFVPMALVGMLAWSVGESLCRERWGRKLAAFDALLQRRWNNATVAQASFRGVAAGLAIGGGLLALGLALRPFGVWMPVSFFLGPWWESAVLPGVALLALTVTMAFYGELFGRLFLLPLLARRAGVVLGGAGAVAASVFVLFMPAYTVPFLPGLLLGAVVFTAYVVLFLRYDLLTVLLASIVSGVSTAAWPLLSAADRPTQVQGLIALGGAVLPLFLTLRHVFSDDVFEYRYEDIPPHVRRIAERERHRVELETARNIQSSILPQLPPRLAGVDLAHAYLPASEVGGDFYDVLALDDGRLAIAVGDVAGHGVSSGLVMSMAKSALAVQVTFDPEVEAVFTTLNRMVYQSARKRLLATLCYALLDPRRRELHYASAGHLFPYRLAPDGGCEALDMVEKYPLGVRPELDVRRHTVQLSAGDTLVLYSDGVVEARRDGSDDIFGFTRLEMALRRHAGKSPEALRDALLADVAAFTGGAPREDDLTLLVLRLPAA